LHLDPIEAEKMPQFCRVLAICFWDFRNVITSGITVKKSELKVNDAEELMKNENS